MKHWYFWVLAPVLMASAVIVPATAEPHSIGGRLGVRAFSAVLLLATLGLADSARFRWALRVVAGAVLVAGALYFGSELVAWRAGKPLGIFGRPSRSSLWNAGLFLLMFGLPALRYLVSGRSGSVVDEVAVEDDDPTDPGAAADPIEPE